MKGQPYWTSLVTVAVLFKILQLFNTVTSLLSLAIPSFRRKYNKFPATVHLQLYASSVPHILYSQHLFFLQGPQGMHRGGIVQSPLSEEWCSAAELETLQGKVTKPDRCKMHWWEIQARCKWIPVKLRWGQGRQGVKRELGNMGGGRTILKLAATQEHCSATGGKWGYHKANGRCIN